MANLNKVMLIGRLTADPELKYTPSNIAVTSFSIAVNRRAKSGEQAVTDFIDIVAWRNTAEFITKYFSKGRQILIVGSIQTRNFEDKNGNKRKVFEILADEVSFVDSKSDNPRASAAGGEESSFTNMQNADFQEISDDDELPF